MSVIVTIALCLSTVTRIHGDAELNVLLLADVDSNHKHWPAIVKTAMAMIDDDDEIDDDDFDIEYESH